MEVGPSGGTWSVRRLSGEFDRSSSKLFVGGEQIKGECFRQIREVSHCLRTFFGNFSRDCRAKETLMVEEKWY